MLEVPALIAVEQVPLAGQVLGQGDCVCLGLAAREDVAEGDQELGELPDAQQLPPCLDGIGPFGSDKQNCLVSTHSGGKN